MHVLYYYTYAGYIIRQVIVRDRGTDGISRSILWLLLLLYRQLVRIKVYSDKLCRVCCVLRGERFI